MLELVTAGKCSMCCKLGVIAWSCGNMCAVIVSFVGIVVFCVVCTEGEVALLSMLFPNVALFVPFG